MQPSLTAVLSGLVNRQAELFIMAVLGLSTGHLLFDILGRWPDCGCGGGAGAGASDGTKLVIATSTRAAPNKSQGQLDSGAGDLDPYCCAQRTPPGTGVSGVSASGPLK